jgi:glucosamine 6-phosphate synthetase-like amidotransferase/phosphosugar isomerase protein
MCGIFRAVATKPVGDVVIEGLRRLEDRGYACAGLAILDQRELKRIRTVGKLAVRADPIAGQAIQPMIALIPLQLLACHIALTCGRDVDRPRNLAKLVRGE